MAMPDQTMFSEDMFSSSFEEEFKKHWNLQGDFKSPRFEIISEPFKICKISNFLRNEEFLENLKKELTNHHFNRLYTDLYQFERTNDLVNASGDYIPTLYKSFQSTLVRWMKRNTDIKLNGKISMSGACYRDTHHLLCHDDLMTERRIAYILYLSKDWTEQDGGTLDLFDMNQDYAPGKVVKSLIPEYNSLVFFEVTNKSYHQVSEVITNTKCRLSINGWFHGPTKLFYSDYTQSRHYEVAKLLEPNVTEMQLNSWITINYLLPRIIEQIQMNVEHMSYAFLKDFLKKSTYQQITKDLTSQNISWQMVGPADMRHYELADEETLPESLRQLCDLFKSISFFRLMKKYTGLDLIPEAATATSRVKRPKMKLELQRWSAGCYTLLYDRMSEDAKDKADADISDEFNISDESINDSDNECVFSAQLDDITTSSPSTAKTFRDEAHQQLKRKRTESSPEKDGKRKMIINIDQESPTEREIGHPNETSPRATTSGGLHQVESAAGSSTRKSQGISREAEVDVATGAGSDSEEDEEGTSVFYDISGDSNLSDDDEGSLYLRDGYSLDVMMQFHTMNARGAPKTQDTINYVNPYRKEGVIIEIPQKDNYLSLAYKSSTVYRLQPYMNHLYDGYTYTLLCVYYE